MGRRLGRAWYARSADVLAPALLGQVLVRHLPSGEFLRVRVVETEAYLPGDPASHAYRGPTQRNASMFDPGGHAYVYVVYGMHFCLNVVAGSAGEGAAVLVRAVEPLEGIERMRSHRPGVGDRDLCRGPARLAAALAVDRTLDGIDLTTSDTLWIEAGPSLEPEAIVSGPRIGVRAGVEHPWRFVEAGSRWISRPAVTPRVRAGARRA
jgi:DNA-3-methyladenine glycosylase